MAGEINSLSGSANLRDTSKSQIDLVTSQRYIITSFVKDVYLIVMRELFGQNAGPFEYNDDSEVTKLHISDRLEIPKESQTLKPMIYLTRGRMGYSNLTIDNLKAMNMNTGEASYMDLVKGTMLINCAAGEGLEAEHLASLVFVLLESFKKRFYQLGFHHFAVGEILEERPLLLGVDVRLTEVGVTTVFSFPYSWAIAVMNSTKLKDIRFSRAREVDVSKPYCTSEVNSCGISIGIDGTGKDCGAFESLAIKGEAGDIETKP